MRIGGDEAGADVAIPRPLDPPRGEHAVGIAVDEQRQHQPRVVLRLAAGLRVGVERPSRTRSAAAAMKWATSSSGSQSFKSGGSRNG